MPELQPIPRVIAALDTDAEHIQEILDSIGNFEGDLGVQIRASTLIVHGDDVIRRAQDKGFYVIANYHPTDAPQKQAFDIHEYVLPKNIFGRTRRLPDAFTIQPQRNTDSDAKSLQRLKNAIAIAQSRGITIIGAPGTYSTTSGHKQDLIHQTINACHDMQTLDIDATEIIFPILDDVMTEKPSIRNIGQIIVSKTTERIAPPYSGRQSVDERSLLNEGVRRAVALGATSILLGKSIVGEVGEQRPTITEARATVDQVLNLMHR